MHIFDEEEIRDTFDQSGDFNLLIEMTQIKFYFRNKLEQSKYSSRTKI